MGQEIRVGDWVTVTCNYQNNPTQNKKGVVLFDYGDRYFIGFFCGGLHSNSAIQDYRDSYKGLRATWTVPSHYLSKKIKTRSKFK